jgi:hypothetical protein
MMRLLPLLLALAGCGVAGWQEPPRGLRDACDDAGARGNVGRGGDVDARPRPECRPGAPVGRP